MKLVWTQIWARKISAMQVSVWRGHFYHWGLLCLATTIASRQIVLDLIQTIPTTGPEYPCSFPRTLFFYGLGFAAGATLELCVCQPVCAHEGQWESRAGEGPGQRAALRDRWMAQGFCTCRMRGKSVRPAGPAEELRPRPRQPASSRRAGITSSSVPIHMFFVYLDSQA